MLHNLFWLAVCILLVAAAFCLVRWSSRFPSSPAPQTEQPAPASPASSTYRRRRQAGKGDDSAFTRAA